MGHVGVLLCCVCCHGNDLVFVCLCDLCDFLIGSVHVCGDKYVFDALSDMLVSCV